MGCVTRECALCHYMTHGASGVTVNDTMHWHNDERHFTVISLCEWVVSLENVFYGISLATLRISGIFCVCVSHHYVCVYFIITRVRRVVDSHSVV